MKEVVSFDHVTFSYDEIPIIQNASFAVEEGELIGIFGPNGGGKTTLLKLLMGFNKPDSGRVTLFGKKPRESHQSIGYVPQKLPFDANFPISVLEVVLTGCLSKLPWHGRYSAEHEKSAYLALEQVDMEMFSNQAFGTLSGGQAQRVLIARALVSSPRLLVLDEPTAGIDAQTETEIYKQLDKLRGKVTIIMVTHHLRIVTEFADRVLLVQRDVTSLNSKELCEHFAIGLYHPPHIGKERS
ncbi:MAG: ABC transporter ATP-binding protein [Waddliaceae bacterium]